MKDMMLDLARKAVDWDYVRQASRDITPEHLDEVHVGREKVRRKLKRGVFKKMLDRAALMIDLLRDYRQGDYRQVPWRVVAAVAFALLYLLTPLDLVPDFIPGSGLMDDAAVLLITFQAVEKELKAYSRWREEAQRVSSRDSF